MDERELIRSRAADLATLAERREYEFVYSAFLSPAEQAEFFSAVPGVLRSRLFFYGGCALAERRRAVIIPSFVQSEAPPAADAFSRERERVFIDELYELFPDETLGCIPLHVRGSGFARLSHRDYLGSVLALGVERSVIGDIAVMSERDAFIFADGKLVPFLEEQLLCVARDKVSCAAERVGRDFTVPRRFEEMNIVAAGTRVDAVVASLAGLSRAEAKRLCVAGEVQVNHVTVTEGDRELAVGDTVAVRSHGKYIIDSFGSLTRSGRLRFGVRRYI